MRMRKNLFINDDDEFGGLESLRLDDKFSEIR
jgi:hypothetical protein